MKLGCCVAANQISTFHIIDKFDFIEVKLDELISSPNIFSGYNIFAVNNIFPRDLNIFSDDIKKVFERIDLIFQLCESYSIKVITLGSGISRSYLEGQNEERNRDVWITILKYFNKLASEKNIMVGIEPLNKTETNFINTFSEALNYLNTLDLKNIGITLDTYHFTYERNSFSTLESNVDKIVHFHISGDRRNYPLNVSKINSKFIELLTRKNYANNASIEIDRKKTLLNSMTFVNKFKDYK